ncbi:MAG: site-specific DNA-methyltransferase [Fibromonadaceae bacterium]|jgi:site-specific DNA-methyltransferase (adenine-specific)|nr:site-specific DNA-methyltransferase [Fibromonadaceae bacterium]
MPEEQKTKNKTILLSQNELEQYSKKIVRFQNKKFNLKQILNKTICADLFDVLDELPKYFVDLLIIDPPYNLNKNFNGLKFSETDDAHYLEYLESWFPKAMNLLKPNGSVYLCGDWKCSAQLYLVMKKYAKVRNRIIWQREKGRGAKANWKNASEDIWFGTKGNDYYFDVEAVKQKRKVLAPYKENGKPKDWEETENGKFRLTYPSNFWDDISVPYWSMPENTKHPTQKPEKLFAKLILASCPENGIVLDPFLGSGTTSVVAKKLNRQFVGIEMNEEYCCFAEKRLDFANLNKKIQGYSNGVFWERNTANLQMRKC